MSSKKKRNKRRQGESDCCILCTLYRQAEEQDESWSVSDRADELVARMRAAQAWDGGFTPLIRSPREELDRFAHEWLIPRTAEGEPTEGMRVSVSALERFWDSYHRPVPA